MIHEKISLGTQSNTTSRYDRAKGVDPLTTHGAFGEQMPLSEAEIMRAIKIAEEKAAKNKQWRVLFDPSIHS